MSSHHCGTDFGTIHIEIVNQIKMFFIILMCIISLTNAVYPFCGENEKMDICPRKCPPEYDCNMYLNNIVFLCAQEPPDAPCEPACRCMDGFIRSKDGVCIKPESCCEGNSELVDCPSACPPTCDNPSPKECPEICRLRGCQCKKGYLLHEDKCILPEQCPQYPTCGINEILNKNPGPCVPGEISYCYEYIKNQPNECDPSAVTGKLEPRCDCIKDYLRNDNGKCVKKEDCCADPNEIVVDCPDPCPLSCDNLETHGKFPCARMCLIRGCACRDGFVRDANNKCILKEKCPQKCKPSEVFIACISYCSFDDDCGKIINGWIRDCAAPPQDYQCPSGCRCKPGLVRIGEDCVSPDKCCSDPNQIAVSCPSACDETCDGKPAADCQLTPCFEKGCKCKPGYVKDAQGKCILKCQCPKACSGPNEIYKECGTCDGSCSDPNPICAQVCRPGCYCKDGYVRDSNGKCILTKSCPKTYPPICTKPPIKILPEPLPVPIRSDMTTV